MVIKKFFVIFFLFLGCSTYGQIQKIPVLTSVEQMGLLGKVKYIRDSTFALKMVENKEVWVPVLINVSWFDDKGNRESVSTYNGSGELSSKTSYNYNQLGLLTGFISEDKNNKQIQQMLFVYDKNNLLIRSKDFDENKEMIYDTNIEYVMNAGTRTEMKKRNGKFLDSAVVMFNPDNTMKSKTWYANSKLTAKDEYLYANNTTFPIEKKRDFGGRKCLEKYDTSGNMLESKCDDGSIVTYTYVFGIIKNWIERTKFQDGKLAQRQKRKISYYSAATY